MIISISLKRGFMTIYIKNMVSIRCKMAVEAALRHVGLPFTRIELGLAEIPAEISIAQRNQIRSDLLQSGLEVIDDIKSILVERVKKIIIELVHYSEEPLPVNLSTHLSQQLHYNYTYMANVFSETQGHSIERFVIEHKIERVKELLIYNELSLTAISCKMHYSSVAHLSSQFKKVTGHTASQYRRLQSRTRMPLETI
jgi:AraC-like DNA-binding protein